MTFKNKFNQYNDIHEKKKRIISNKKEQPKWTKQKKLNHQTIVCHILGQSKNMQDIFERTCERTVISVLFCYDYIGVWAIYLLSADDQDDDNDDNSV